MRKVAPIEEHNFRSEEVQEILTSPPIWIVRWGVTLIFLFTIIILTLSFIIKYPDFVSAKVVVTTKQPTEKVISRFSGQLDQILINNKDQVKANQILALIENSASYKDVMLLKKYVDSVQYNIRNFSFPIDTTSRLVLGDIEPAYIEFEKSYIDYRLFNEFDPYDNQLNGNKSSLNEVKIQLQSQIDQRDLLNQELTFKGKEIERYRTLYRKGVISQQEYESKELEYLQMQKSLNNMTISISQIREAIASADQTLKSTYISKNEDDTRLLKNLLQSFNTLKRAIREWEYKYVLSSSIEGTVSFQEFWGIHQQINQGEMVFSILPSNHNELIGRLTIPSQNAGKVKVDQKVLVKLDNYSYQQYGMLIGYVNSISVSPDDEGNYFVYISLPKGTTTSYNKTLKFNQELLGSAEIITEDLSVAERLFYKFRDLFKY